ncbi:hypothetical protein BOW53_00155 [Solemya pervernicosa gill symbiont]|uniref:Pilus assembly protein PilN n=1 Tax=Solemya pervernicosa gill symbiont TaxID=642797 RepID=A0A1T2LBA3_9GAMM|nr:PilN domain-containing protein [Solemya pervernicosa gill symbiont]OOZ42292.1 hypothetical protein BOW53_00155 [Solemya pervernicosa gill symbiont]
MAHINLLPWREELRKERQQRFIASGVIAALITGAAFFYMHTYAQSLIEGQQERNNYLSSEIKLLDKKIAEIKVLEETKSRLIQKMEIIQQLQNSRPQVVHLFDELVRTLPDGVYLNNVSQKGKGLAMNGTAESNARVSAYMRNIDTSDWIGSPKLSIITGQESGPGRINNFKLSATQIEKKNQAGNKQ